jgi:RING-box protein 1
MSQTDPNQSTHTNIPSSNDDIPRVQLKLLSPVATWSWVLNADSCSICRTSLTAICMKCQTKSTGGNTKCSVSWGKCGHAFHTHCIDDWTKTRQVCPIDELAWTHQQTADIIA